VNTNELSVSIKSCRVYWTA